MIGVITIARYEITRRWGLWLVALGLGFVPLLFMPGGPFESRGYGVGESLLLLGAVLSWTVAFVLGMTLVGRPLHDGRLSFYFTRPFPAAAIVAGKVLGGVALIIGMELALAGPLFAKSMFFSESSGLLFLVLLAIVFLAVGLVVGILARSRSRWFVADALGAAIVSTVSVAMFAALNARKAEIARDTPEWIDAKQLFLRIDVFLRVLVAAAVIATLVAVIAAVASGRTDRDRVHRMLSLTLWPALTAVALVGLALAHGGFR